MKTKSATLNKLASAVMGLQRSQRIKVATWAIRTLKEDQAMSRVFGVKYAALKTHEQLTKVAFASRIARMLPRLLGS